MSAEASSPETPAVAPVNAVFEKAVLKALADLKSEVKALGPAITELKSDVKALASQVEGLKASPADAPAEGSKIEQRLSSMAELLGELATRILKRRPRPAVAAGIQVCVRVLKNAYLERGPNGRPWDLGARGIISGEKAEWLLARHPELVEVYPPKKVA